MSDRPLPDPAASSSAQPRPRPPSLGSDGSSPTWLADSNHTWGGPSVLLTAGWAGEVIDIARIGPNAGQTSERAEGRDVAARFEQLVLLGKGGMGEVWRVRDVDLNRIVAMKIVRMGRGASEPVFARFVAEAQATAQLEHPGIVPVYELGRLPDGRIYYTMQEIRGRNMAAVLTDLHTGSRPDAFGSPETGLGFLKVMEAFRQVCDTIAYAHARGVIHRDLKPANIMLGAFGEVRVVDWGLVKVLDASGSPASDGEGHSPLSLSSGDSSGPATSAGAVAGTRGYMSPEQARGEIDRLSPASDVYALGGILFAILAGAAPGDQDLNEVLSALPRVPPQLVAVCSRAMATDATQRYTDAGQLGAAISQWLERAAETEQSNARIQRIEAAFEALSASAQADVRETLLRLHGGDGRPVARRAEELDESGVESLRQLGLIQVQNGSVLIRDADLLSRWDRLSSWVDSERDILPLRQGLHDQALAWERHGRQRDQLWQGEQLAELERWIRQRNPRLRASEAAFARESREHGERTHRRKKFGTIGVIAALSCGLLFTIGLERRTSDALDEAETARAAQKQAMDMANARALGAEAALATYMGEPHRAVALGMASLSILPGEQHVADRLAMRVSSADALTVLSGHKGFAYHVEWLGPDRAVSAGIDRTLKVWDTARGQQVTSIELPRAAVTIGPSPDGKRVAAILEDGSFELVDATTGARIQSTRAHKGFGLWAEYNQSGDRIFTLASGEPARVWDGLTGEPLYTVAADGGEAQSGAFSRDGKRLLVWSEVIVVVDAATGAELFRAPKGLGGGRAAISPDGRQVAISRASGELSLFEIEGGKPRWTAKLSHGERAPRLAFDPTGERLYVAYDRGPLSVLEASTGEVMRTIQREQSSLQFLEPSPSGRYLMTVAGDSLTLWDGETLTRLDTLRDPGGLIPIARFSRDEQTIALASEAGVVRVWRPRVLGANRVDICGGSRGKFLADSANGEWLVLSTEGGLCVRPADEDTPQPGLKGREGRPLAIQKDGARLVLVDAEGDAMMVDTSTGAEIWRVPGPVGLVSGALSDHERMVILQGNDRVLHLLDASTGEEKATTAPIDLLMSSTPLQDLFAQAVVPLLQTDMSIQLVESDTGAALRHLPAGWTSSSGLFTSHAIAGGRRFVTGDSVGTVRLFDPHDDRPPVEINFGDAAITSVTGTNQGNMVAALDNEGELYLLDGETGKILKTIHTGDTALNRVLFSPDDRRISTSGSEGPLTVWEVETGLPIWRWPNPDHGPSAGCVLDSGKLLHWTGDALRIWDLTPPAAGALTNLRVCPGTVDVVAVQPYPDASEVWAPAALCSSEKP